MAETAKKLALKVGSEMENATQLATTGGSFSMNGIAHRAK